MLNGQHSFVIACSHSDFPRVRYFNRLLLSLPAESSASSAGGGDAEDDSLEGLLKLQKGRRKAGVELDPGLDERPAGDADFRNGKEGYGGVEAAVEAVAGLSFEDSMQGEMFVHTCKDERMLCNCAVWLIETV